MTTSLQTLTPPGAGPDPANERLDSQAGQGLRRDLDAILILDGNTRSALAATRSLGRKGVRVVVADETKRTLAGSSRYCSETFAYPPPGTDSDAFIAAIRQECARRRVGVIFPMAEVSMAIVLSRRKELRGAAVPCVEAGTFDLISDKGQLVELAHRLGIRTPKTHFVGDRKSLRALYSRLEFPVVLKPCRSRIRSEGRWISASVKYAGSVRELEEHIDRFAFLKLHPFLVQEYVPGRGHGIFALYDKGRPAAWFAHRRLRERPPSGGVSVLSESVDCNPAALRMARTLLDYVGWHGVAMVEFKVTREGVPYLMEVNGRFWGSLQLAIDAGVDFPWLLYQLATGKTPDQVHRYARGVRSRWLLGDLASLYRTLSGNGSAFHLRPAHKAASVIQFLKLIDQRTRYEVNRWDDIKPFFFELSHCLGQ